MARLSQAQSQARERLNRIAASGDSPTGAAGRIAAALDGAIGWDGFRLLGVDPQTRLINRVLAASAGDDAVRDEWFRDVYLRASDYGLGFIELDYLMRSRLRAVAFQDRLADNFGYPAQLIRAQDEVAYRRNFVRNQAPIGGSLLANFNAGERWVASLLAYRREPGRPFRTGDIAFVQTVAGLIGDTIAAALARESATPSTSADDRPAQVAGIVVLQRSGRVQFASPAGEAWIEALRASPGEATTQLPSAVWGAMAGLGDGRPRAVNAVRLASGAATIEATPGGQDGTVALIISPVREMAGVTPPAHWGLTGAEERVAALVVQGHGNRAVAERLSISEHTVEWHLRHVFDRLDVRSRAAAHRPLLPGHGTARPRIGLISPIRRGSRR